MKVNFNKVLNHSLQIKSCKEIIQEQKEHKKATYKRCGSELLTIGMSKEKQFIHAKLIDEKYEEFKRDVGRMEQYMISYIHKLSGKLIRFADDQRKALKQTAADKNSELVQGNMPKFEYSKTRIGNFKRATQVLMSLIKIKPDEKPLDHAFEEIERLTAVIIDLEKEVFELKNGKPQPLVEEPVIEVVDFAKLNFYEKGEYVKNSGIDIGYLRNITGYAMTKDGGFILVCMDYEVCIKD